MWKKKYCTAGQATDGNMVHAHCMLDTEACNYTHSQYVTFIALPPQQRLHERAPLLRHTYISCLISYKIVSEASRAPVFRQKI